MLLSIITIDRVEITGGLDKVIHNGTYLENFTGTGLDDSFVVEAGVAPERALNWMAADGYDTLDYSAYGQAHAISS